MIINFLTAIKSFFDMNYGWFLLGLLVIIIILIFLVNLYKKSFNNERVVSRNLLDKSIDNESNNRKEVNRLNAIISEKDRRIASDDKMYQSTLKDQLKFVEELKEIELERDTLKEEIENLKNLHSEELESLKKVIASEVETKSALEVELENVKLELANKIEKLDESHKEIETLLNETDSLKRKSDETIDELKVELKFQKDINSALILAIQEFGRNQVNQQVSISKIEATTEEPTVTRKEELILVAKTLGIEGCYKMKKDELVEAIQEKLNKDMNITKTKKK